MLKLIVLSAAALIAAVPSVDAVTTDSIVIRAQDAVHIENAEPGAQWG